jgi:anti-sigma B factor antagonist
LAVEFGRFLCLVVLTAQKHQSSLDFAMKLQTKGETLRIFDITELGAANANAFRDQARAAMTNGHKHIEIDLSQTAFIDSCGLGALIALHKTACSRKGTVRLLNPQPPVQQILELTRMHHIFQISTTPTDASVI